MRLKRSRVAAHARCHRCGSASAAFWALTCYLLLFSPFIYSYTQLFKISAFSLKHLLGETLCRPCERRTHAFDALCHLPHNYVVFLFRQTKRCVLKWSGCALRTKACGSARLFLKAVP